MSRLLPGKGPGSDVGSNSVTMALKLAPPFQNTSWEVQVGAAAASVGQVVVVRAGWLLAKWLRLVDGVQQQLQCSRWWSAPAINAVPLMSS